MRVKSVSTNPEIVEKGYYLTSFIVDDLFAVDGGSLGIGVSLDVQKRIKYVLLTHVHIDHVATLPIFIDNMIPFKTGPKILTSGDNIEFLKKHIFNDILWPNFERIAEKKYGDENKFFSFLEVEPEEEKILDGYEVKFFEMDHIVPTNGIKIVDVKKNVGVIFSSDTLSLKNLVDEVNGDKRIKAAFVELSFPNSFREVAKDSKHLCAEKLLEEIHSIERDIEIFIVHYKKVFAEDIKRDIEKSSFSKNIKMMLSGEELEIG